MKYIIFLLLLTSCNVRYQIETPWYTSHTIMWNKPFIVDDIATITITSDQILADYPGFETWFKMESCNDTQGELTLYLDRQWYKREVTIVKEFADVWIGIISDKEYIRINKVSMITTLKFKGMHRVYVQNILQ